MAKELRMKKLSTFRRRWLRAGLIALLALVGGVFYATKPAQAADAVTIDVWDGSAWVSHNKDDDPTTFPAGISWDDTKGFVLNDYVGNPIKANPDTDTLNFYVVGAGNTITATGANYGLRAEAIKIKGNSDAKLAINSEDDALYRQPDIHDITLVANGKIEGSSMNLYGSAKVIVNSTKPKNEIFWNLTVYDTATVNVTVDVNRSKATYGVRNLTLRGTGKVSFTVNNAGAGLAQAIASEPTLVPGYSATSGAWNGSLVVYEYSAPVLYNITAGPFAHGNINPSKDSALAGDEIFLLINPSSGYQLKAGTLKVMQGPNVVPFIEENRFVMPAGDVVITAEFEEVPAPVVTYNLTINCGVGGTCTPNHANPYNDGETATITITPSAGKQVKSVTGATKVNDTTYTVLMNADKTVAVEFEDIPVLPVTLSTDKAIIKQNESLVVKIDNLGVEHEGKTVEFWLNSDPVKLGEATVLHGSATVTALVPCGVKPGDHTVTAKIDGINIGTPVTVTVLSSPVCPASPKTGVGSNYLVTILAAGALISLGVFGLLRSRQQN